MAELTTNQKSLVGYMTKSHQHAAHGFELLLKSENPEDFFGELLGAGLLDPNNNPQPQPVEGKEEFFRVPFWPALSYLTHIAKISGEKDDATLGAELMILVRAISAHHADGQAVDNYHTHSALAEILGAVPTCCVTVDDVDLVKDWLYSRWNNSSLVSELDKGAMRAFLQSDADVHKAVRLLWICTELRPTAEAERPLRTREAVADAYWLEQLLEHHATAIGEKGRDAGMDCLLSRLRELFSEEFVAESSWLNRPAIEPHEQNHEWDHVTNAFVDAARDALTAWLNIDSDSARPYVKSMLGDDSQIVRRLAFHAIRTHWEVLGSDFETAISAALFDTGHLHELYLLLNDRYGQFSEPAKVGIFEQILFLTKGTEADIDSLERTQYRQLNWLHAIRGKGDKRTDAEYERLTQIVGPMREHPDFLSYSSSWWGTGPSPYTQDEIVAFAKDRSLISRIDSYSPPVSEAGETRKSLIDALSDAVAAYPTEFVWALSPTERMSRRVQYGLINGFAKLIDKAKGEAAGPSLLRLVIPALLPYLDQLVSDAAFWMEPAENPDAFEPNKNWIPPVLVEVAKKLVSNDASELSEEDFDRILRIIESVRTHSTGITMTDDPMTAAINNTRGMAVDAWLQVLLRRCRESDKGDAGNHQAVWAAMMPSLDEEVCECVEGRSLESSTLLASYLAQLLYVDDTWVVANITRLFPFAHTNNLTCAVAGLAFANSTKRAYEVLKLADVPRFALRLPIGGSPREHLIERVALAYMWGQEQLDSPCIAEMFATDRLDDLVKLAATVSRWASEKLKTDQVERAKALAKKCVAFGLEDQISRQRLLATASRFISYVQAPTEEDLAWLIPATAFAHGSHYEDHFLESLDKIATVDASRAVAILTRFLENYQFTYDFRGLLQSIVRKVDASGRHLDALKLVNELVRKGGGLKWVELYRELVDVRATAGGDATSTETPEKPEA